jgi:glycosyltransferase involved in cell wall biosynthesis
VAEPLTVSVVIPVYNGERFLAEAIASVIAQSRPAQEIIVVDDGSTDGSAAVARAFGPRVTLLQQANAWAGAARNTGIAAAKGTALAFLDADDLWPPDKLEAQVGTLEAHEHLDLVFGQVVQFHHPAGEELAPVSGPIAGNMVARRASFDRVGPFITEYRLGEFIDWYGRAVDAGLRMLTLDRVVLRRRIHDTNTGILSANARPDYAAVLRAAIQRRRAAGGGE